MLLLADITYGAYLREDNSIEYLQLPRPKVNKKLFESV